MRFVANIVALSSLSIALGGCNADRYEWNLQQVLQPDSPQNAALHVAIFRDDLGRQLAERFKSIDHWDPLVLDAYLSCLVASEKVQPDTFSRSGSRDFFGHAVGPLGAGPICSTSIEKAQNNLEYLLKNSGETSDVTVITENPKARVRYLPVMFKGVQEPMSFSDFTTPATQSKVTIGRYYIWTERDDAPTSSTDEMFWIIDRNAGPFTIEEEKK